MAVVRSAGQLIGLERRGVWPPGTATGFWPTSKEPLAFSEGFTGPELVAPSGWYGMGAVGSQYATLYRTQPALRTVIDACARNIAQLGLHTYERVSDTDRRRDTTSGLATIVTYPNPATTQYRLIEHTLIDFFVYGNAFVVKLRQGDADDAPTEIWRLPAGRVSVEGALYPEVYWVYTLDGRWYALPPRDVIHFREAHPGVDTVWGLSKIETLRRKLLEEIYAQGYRTTYWRQGARLGGVIERPLEAPEWDKATREYFRQEFNEVYGGGRGAGLVPVLDEGMTFKEVTHSAEEQQLADARELHDEEIARAYHMPLPVVGLLRRSTFANVRELHKMLYQDGLGPTIQMVEQELETRLVPEFADRGSHYLEFNVNEKLRGSFEEQVASLSTAVGRPWMTANEARARQNMPRSTNPADDAIALPLNMTTSDQPAPVGDEAL